MFLAFVVEATAGFGATVVTVTLMAHLIPIPEILATFLPVSLGMSAYLVVRYRRHIDRAVLVRRVLPWMGAGMAVGMALTQIQGERWLRTVFGVFVVVLATVDLWRELRGGDSRPLGRARSWSALVGAGVFHGLFACGGPLLVYVLGRDIEDKARFRATLSAVWLTLTGVLVAGYAIDGVLTAATAKTSGLLLLSLGGGIVVGELLHARLDQRRFRQVVFGLLWFAGAALLART